MDKHIGWIGTGVMGKSMCAHIILFQYTIGLKKKLTI